MSGPACRAAWAWAYSIWPFSRSLRHVITLLLTFTAVKHVSSPNHNKDNRGSALRSIAQQVDICMCVCECACWHYSWAVIWSARWSKCLWWLGVIYFPGLWSMVCSWMEMGVLDVCVCLSVCVCACVEQTGHKSHVQQKAMYAASTRHVNVLMQHIVNC